MAAGAGVFLSDDLRERVASLATAQNVTSDAMLNALVVPEGVNEADLRKRLLNDYHIEVSSGLGSLAGKIIRIGLMGYNAEEYNVDRVVNAMKEILAK